MFTRFFSFLCFLLLSSSVALAGDEALYDREPPADAAFFRLVNLTDNDTLKVELDGKSITKVAALRVSPYGFTEKKECTFLLNGTAYTTRAEPKSQFTLVWDGEHTSRIDEDIFSSRSKARIKLFNLSNVPISLKTVDGKTDVIAAVEPQSSGYRDVNALAIAFAFYGDDTNLLATEKISLKKGQATSLFLVQSGKAYMYMQRDEER